ncbi:DUF6230 family protein [Nocardioides sp. B-3]|uniref:DUF6230 family protein n=1 Tax=Nocardioides sp. B-3 TaxID=2895565 RepID=UPI0021524C7A|nr:DUF6230 family protein [Nocardioides sp. B-3]UUZ61465.1 DUF6230 family protein [Nocardioides sp. B-3]
MAVNITTSDQHFKVYSNYVQGVYGAAFTAPNNGTGPTDNIGVTEIGFKNAKLAGLCLITTQELGPIGTTSVIITGGVPVKASFDHSAPGRHGCKRRSDRARRQRSP